MQTGITLVGVSSLLAGEGSASHQVSQWQMLAGMMLIILSQVRFSPQPLMPHASSQTT